MQTAIIDYSQNCLLIVIENLCSFTACSGALSKAIVKAGGPTIQTECNKQGLMSQLFVMVDVIDCLRCCSMHLVQ
jgi:hypothetical protein